MSWVVSTQSELVCLIWLLERRRPRQSTGRGCTPSKMQSAHRIGLNLSQILAFGFYSIMTGTCLASSSTGQSSVSWYTSSLFQVQHLSVRPLLYPSRSSRRSTEVHAHQPCPESCIWPATPPGELEETNDLKHSGAVWFIFKGIFGLCCHNIVWKRYPKM